MNSALPTSMNALERYGLPAAVTLAYAEKGITSLYDWQAECLAMTGVLEGRNLVYCAPTSGGKTLVSEILMLRRVVALKKRAIFVLPYVSIVAEKAKFLQSLCRGTQLSIIGLYGGSIDAVSKKFDIAVCTIEKANALVNRLAEEGTLIDGLCSFVVDELHLVGDESRGYLLEVSISKVLHLASAAQVVGLSATLPNSDIVAKWLSAALYLTSYRPVPLTEYVLVGKELLDAQGLFVREIHSDVLPSIHLQADANIVAAAVWEAAQDGHSVLVFCPSKLKCERIAEALASCLPDISDSIPPGAAARRSARETLVLELRKQPCGLDPTLERSLPRGIAYHHSGLTTEERSQIENAYCAGTISIICATSTLAAGVNLPARRVVFQSPQMGNRFLDATQYRQMAGRAGRAGQGVLGESILIANKQQRANALDLLRQSLPDVKSRLQGEGQGLERLLLEVLSVTSLGTGADLIRFCNSTLLATENLSKGREPTGDPAKDYPEIASAMKFILESDMARLDDRIDAYVVTPLGRAICASGIHPKQGLFLWGEMERARSCMSLDTDLHICYLVAPTDKGTNIDWRIFGRAVRHLSSCERRVAERVGVRLDLLDQAEFQGRLHAGAAAVDESRLRRFFSALILWALLHETPAPVLLQRFAIERGQLQQLQQSAAAYTTIGAVFCNQLQWPSMEALILSFRHRLTFGVRQELVPLMQIPDMDCVVARALYESGFTTPVTVCSAPPREIIRVLRKTLPHHIPSAALPDSKAEALITAAKQAAKSALKEKRKEAINTRKRLREPSPKRKLDSASQASQSYQRCTQTKRQRELAEQSSQRTLKRPPWYRGENPEAADRMERIPCSTRPPLKEPNHDALNLAAPLRGEIDKRHSDWQTSATALDALSAAGSERPPQVHSGQSNAFQKGAAWNSLPNQSCCDARLSVQMFNAQDGVAQSCGKQVLQWEEALAENLRQHSSSCGPPCTLTHCTTQAVSTDGQAHEERKVGERPLEKGHSASCKEAPEIDRMRLHEDQRYPDLDFTPYERENFEDAVVNPRTCATPCRTTENHFAALTPRTQTRVSPAQLSEGLRRIGQHALTPDDVEAVSRSPSVYGHPPLKDVLQQDQPRKTRNAELSGSALSDPTSAQTGSIARRARATIHSEESFLASAFANGTILPLPYLHVIPQDDFEAGRWLQNRLASCCYIGATRVALAAGVDAVCLTLAPNEGWCILLPALGNMHVESPAAVLARWLIDDRCLCVTENAKELVGAFLRRGFDIGCGFVEPRIAQWLLDPEDKGSLSIAEIAAPLKVQLAPPQLTSSVLQGDGLAGLAPESRAHLVTTWSEAFLALPTAARLLSVLRAQGLHDSFCDIEMPIAVVLAWMEHFGLACDPRDPYLTTSHICYKLAALEEAVKEAVGRRVALRSGEDVGRALFEDLGFPVPTGVKFRRKANGRLAYRSSIEVLRKFEESHPVVEYVLEHRRLSHALRSIQSLTKNVEAARVEPSCPSCFFDVASCLPTCVNPASQNFCLANISVTPFAGCPLQRVRTEYVQTGTATGRLSTACGSVPLMCLENTFEVHEVRRPSVYDELLVGLFAESGTRVFVTVASDAPPKRRKLREGCLHCISTTTCEDPFIGESTSLAAYWERAGWSMYSDRKRNQNVPQVIVRHGPNTTNASLLSYPADQVFRLAAPVFVSGNTPKFQVSPRRVLVADAGYVLLSADYCQLEVRLMAHFSQDARFIQILHTDGDIFRHLAAGWLRKGEAEVTAEERAGAKRICYGLVYGIGPSRLACELGISPAQAREFQQTFMAEYGGVARWVKACCEQARRDGFVETLGGRRRFLPALAAAKRADRAHAERQAVNTACQASAADLVKTAMIHVHHRLKAVRSHRDKQCRMIGRMVLHIHDELLFEVDEAHLCEARDIIVSSMVGVGSEMQLSVPLRVKWRSGRRWDSLE